MRAGWGSAHVPKHANHSLRGEVREQREESACAVEGGRETGGGQGQGDGAGVAVAVAAVAAVAAAAAGGNVV